MRVRTRGSIIAACVWLCGASALAGQAGDTKDRARQSEPAFTLKQDMRKLWTDHVVWTRDYIIAAVGDQPDAQAAANRLLKNQEDIGAAVAKFYGAGAGTQLTTLLKDHITIAVDLIKAAKAGDKAAQQQADTKWHQNATPDRRFPEQGQSELAARHAGRPDEQASVDHHR